MFIYIFCEQLLIALILAIMIIVSLFSQSPSSSQKLQKYAYTYKYLIIIIIVLLLYIAGTERRRTDMRECERLLWKRHHGPKCRQNGQSNPYQNWIPLRREPYVGPERPLLSLEICLTIEEINIYKFLFAILPGFCR